MLLACRLLGAEAACRLPSGHYLLLPHQCHSCLTAAAAAAAASRACEHATCGRPCRAVAKHKQRAEEITASIDAKHRWVVRPCFPADPAFHSSHERYFQSSHAPAYCVCFNSGQSVASMPPCCHPPCSGRVKTTPQQASIKSRLGELRTHLQQLLVRRLCVLGSCWGRGRADCQLRRLRAALLHVSLPPVHRCRHPPQAQRQAQLVQPTCRHAALLM